MFQFRVQSLEVLGNDVRQGPAFGLIPNILDRIEVGRVGWEPFDLEPRSAVFKESSGSGAVSRQAIPHQNDWTAQMLMDIANKSNEICGPRIVIQEFVVHSQPQRPWRACDGGDGRNAVTSIPGALNGRMASRCPHSSPRWLQQKAAFIEKNQASLTFEALFLVAAKCRAATGQCSLRCVPGLAARASADSNPADTAVAAHIPDDNPRRTVAGSCPAPAVRSNRRGHTPNNVCHASRRQSILSVAGLKAWASGLDEASLEACFHASKRLSIGTPMKRWSQPPQPLPSMACPSRKAWPRSFDGLRASRGFLLVSCSNCTETTTFPIN